MEGATIMNVTPILQGYTNDDFKKLQTEDPDINRVFNG